MKSFSLKGLAAVAALLLVPLLAVPAQAADFTAADTAGFAPFDAVFTPVLGATPDSIVWIFQNHDASSADTVLDDTAPFTLAYTFETPDSFDVVMHAWFAAVDSTVAKWVADQMEYVYVAVPPQVWTTQLAAWFVDHSLVKSECSEAGVEAAKDLWHFDAYPPDLHVPVMTFAVRNSGILDNLTDATITSNLPSGMEYAVDSIYLYQDDGDSIFTSADTPIDSVEVSGGFVGGSTETFTGFFAELPREGNVTYFHVLLGLDFDTLRANPNAFTVYYPDSMGLGAFIGEGDLTTEHENGGTSHLLQNICYDFYQAGGPAAPPQEAAYTVMLHFPTWGESQELHAWYVSHYWITDSSHCDQSGVDSAYMSWHFDAFPYDDQVPLLTFAIRNTGPLDTLQSVTITSEFEVGDAVSRLWLFRDDGDSVFDAGDLGGELHLENTPGTFAAGATLEMNSFNEVLNTGDTRYFHIVGDMNTAGIIAAPLTFDGMGMGIMVDGAFRMAPSSFSMYDPTEGTGLHTGADDAVVLTDAGQSWTASALVDMTITNLTDGGSATITANTGTTVTGVLAGGTDDDWDTDDQYEITLLWATTAPDSSVVQNPCYVGGSDIWEFGAIIGVPDWGDELNAFFVSDSILKADCDTAGIRRATDLWHFDLGPYDSANVLTFSIANSGQADTLTSVAIQSQNEMEFNVGMVALYQDDGDSVWDAADTEIMSLDLTSVAFDAGADTAFLDLLEILPGFTTTYYHVVAWMNTDSILTDSATYQSYDLAGLGFTIPPDGIMLTLAADTSNSVTNPCFAGGAPAGFNGIFQTLNWDDAVDPDDDLFAKFRDIDTALVTPDEFDEEFSILTFYIDHVTNFMDDTMRTVTVTSRATVPGMVQTLSLYRNVGAGKKLSATDQLVATRTITGDFDDGDTIQFTGLSEWIERDTSTYFFVVAVLDGDAINGSPLAFMCEKLNVEIAAGDIGMMWAKGTSHLVERSYGYRLTINSLPILISPDVMTFDLFYDNNSDNIANIGDSIRIRVDLSANSPVLVDIDSVWTDLSWWYASLGNVVLEDLAGDYNFEARIFLDSTGGLLEVEPPDDTLHATVWAHGANYVCNLDSASVGFDATVDFVDIIAPDEWDERTFTQLADLDGNGCLALGDSIKLEVSYVDSIVRMDLDSIFANILDAGLGGPEGTTFDRVPLSLDSADTFRDSVFDAGPPSVWLYVDSVRVWYSLVWELQEWPQDSAVDAAGGTLTMTIIGKDLRNNFDTTMTGTIAQSVDTEIPGPISGLYAKALPNGGVRLCWDDWADDAEYFLVYHDSAGVRGGFPDSMYAIDSAVINGSLTHPGGSPDSLCWESDLTTGLQHGKLYNFMVRTMDDCGNMEYNAVTVAVVVDSMPPYACVFQPDTGSVYSQGIPISVYVEPANDSADGDVAQVKALGRLIDRGDGNPGPWVDLSGWITQTLSGEDSRFRIDLDTAGLNTIVGSETTAKVEVIIRARDEVGNENTIDGALAACTPVFWFWWSNVVLTCEIETINDDSPLWQPYCNHIGFALDGGATNDVELHVEGGTEPYKVRAWISEDAGTTWNEIFYDEGQAADVNFNLDATGLEKGAYDLRVWFKDASHAETSCYANLCMPDTIAPCAIITNPVDGKCIRRSLSQLDPVDVCVTIDPIVNCLDPEDVLKIDFQWADECCLEDEFVTRDTFWFEQICISDTCAYDTFLCDTIPPGATGRDIDTIVCVDSTIGEFVWVRRDSTIEYAIPCEDKWSTFAILQGPGAGPEYCTEWWNTEDLSWITASGTLIYLRAVVYDDQGNAFTTQCVEVCVDIDTPPMCITSPDVCVSDGIEKLAGNFNTIVADLEWEAAGFTYDDIEDVYLYWKKSTDADVYGSWTAGGAGVPATNSTMWRWDQVNTGALVDQVNYDFRVIAKTIWGTWSYDTNGDEEFDAYTFDTTNCDAVSWFIDNSAEPIWIDTVWTQVDGHDLVQPNTSCKLSDPRGWAWAQYGEEIKVQVLAEPFGEMPYGGPEDIVRVVWTLWDGDECASCACEGGFSPGEGCDSKVIAINEGANALDTVRFNPTIAPFVQVVDGYQVHVLHVEAFDACGNSSEDCIEIYLLDIDESEAIIVDPKNHEVFCQDHENAGGGITVSAATLLAEAKAKLVFYYRADGEGTWIPFDSTSGSSVTWFPHALGLADGSYELTVVAEDNAGNRSDLGVYYTTVHLSCGVPTVELTYPTADMFIGCPVEVTATATAPDDFNYITKVEFFYQSVTSSSSTKIGEDLYSVDGEYSVAWSPTLNGDYYLWARVTIKSGVTAESGKVWVRTDNTNPEVNLVQVADDHSDGGSGDPTVVTAGDVVAVYAEAWDRLQADGYGPEDNCGLDSVKLYVMNASGTVIFGELTHPVADAENLFTADWPTSGLPNGTYRAYAVATDSCCNNATSSNWYIKVENPVPPVSIAVDEAMFFCASWRTNADSINFTVTKDALAEIDSVQIWYNSTSQSDVYDQYTWLASSASSTANVFAMYADIGAWTEGTYRMRAVVWINGQAIDDGNDSDTEFDDFTFDAATKVWQMELVVDRSAQTPTFTLEASIITAGTEFAVTVADPPCGDCDVSKYEYGVVTTTGVYGTRSEYTTTECEFSFDPVDSGLVTMHTCYWGGYVRVTAYDPLGNSATYNVWVDILSSGDGYAQVTSPSHGAYIKGTVTLMAKAVGTVTAIVFSYSNTDGTELTEIGTETSWNTEDVDDGEYLLWATADGNTHDIACAVPVVIVNECATVHLADPIPYGTCHEDGQVMFIGKTVDLHVDTLISDVAIDSVVFRYKTLDAPGGLSPDNDPANGWVTLGVDRYKANSWDISWNLADTGKVVPDGYYVIMAFSYDRSGQECHSNSVTVFVDNTRPYSEISEVNGDQTTVTCADVTEGESVEIVAVAVDDRSPLGPSDAYNSCPRYVQFFAGYCGEGASGAVDIVWVVDASGSMGDEQSVIGGQINQFVGSLGGLDYRLAVTAYESEGYFSSVNDSTKSVPMANDGAYDAALVGTGDWTVVESTFNTMVTSVGTGGGTEDGTGSLMETLQHYTFRSNAKKYFILVTDEAGDDNQLEAQAIALLNANDVTVHVVSNPSFVTFSNIAAETGGQVYNIASADWGALLAVLGSQISGASSGATPLDPIWGKTVDLDTDAPSVHWNTTGLAPGEYCLWTVITDNVGNQYTSALVTVCIYDKTPPVAWIAGFGDATVACPICESHRIYAMTCDTDVKALKFEMRLDGSTSELDWTMIGITNMIDSSLWYTDWDPCGLSGTYELRAVPASDHYDVGTEQHIMWDIDAGIQPILDVSFGENCAMTYGSGDISSITFEDRSAGNLGLVNVASASAIDPLTIGVLGVYQPLNEATLTTERVDLVQMMGMTEVAYLGSFDDNDILLGGVGSFYASYYDGLVSYLRMSDVSVSRVYPALGMPGTLHNMATDAYLMIDRDAVSATNGVIILPALPPVMMPSQNDLLNIWPAGDYLPAIRFTNPLEGGLLAGKYAKIKIPYDAAAPIVDSLAVAWWDGDEWVVNQGIFFGGDADGFNDGAGTVEFYSADLYGIYAVVSNDAGPCSGPITVTQEAIEPWYNDFTDHDPIFYTLVRSNITGNDNNWDVDSLQTHVKLDGITIYNNGVNATGYKTTWDNVSGMLKTWWNGAPALSEGDHYYWVEARTFQGCAKSVRIDFEVDDTPPLIDWTNEYVCPNPEFKILITDNGGSGVDLDNIQADVYDHDLSLGTEIPSDKLIYEEHASGFELRGDTLVFSMTAHNANYRRYVVVLWDGTEYGRTLGEDDDDRDYSDYEWVYHNDHGVPDLVGNHATPVFRMFTVESGPECTGDWTDEAKNDPNPFDPWAGEVTTIFPGETGGVVTVKIYDLAGEKVITLAEQLSITDIGEGIVWDGKVDGQYVASGVYLCHISGENGGISISSVLKIAVVKK